MKLLLLFIVPFCSMFIGLGGWIFWKESRAVFLGKSAKDWDIAEARIIECKIEERKDGEGDVIYEVKVGYEYGYQHTEYKGSTLYPPYSGSKDKKEETELWKLLNGSDTVSVHVNPNKPDQSTLIAGYYSSYMAGAFGGLVFFFAGVTFLLTFLFTILGRGDIASGLTILEMKQ